MGREGDVRKGLKTKQKCIYTYKDNAGVCNAHMKAHNTIFNHFVKSFGGVSSGHGTEILWAQNGEENLIGKENEKVKWKEGI